MTKETSSIVVRVQRNGLIILPSNILEKLGVKENDFLKVVSQNRQFVLLKKEQVQSGETQVSARVTFCGSIESFGIADLFSVLNMTQKTGVLTVWSEDAMKTIYFRKGEIVYASSNLPEDRLGDILYKTGKLKKGMLEEVEKTISTSKRFGEILLQKGLIAPKDLWWGVKYQLEEIIYSIFSFVTGEFLFIEGVSPEEDLVRFSLNTQNLLMEGFRRFDEWKLISEKIPSKDVILAIREKTPSVELSSTMEKILTVIDGKADVAEIIRRCELGEFTIYKILYQLLNAGVLHVLGKEEKPAAKEDEGVIALKKTIEKYSDLCKKVFAYVKKENPKFDALGTFNSFFSELSEKLQKLFNRITLNEAGGFDTDRLLQNVKGLKLLESDDFNKIAGLNELFISQLLLEGLNELLNFEFFTIKSALPPEKSEEIIKEIRSLQQGQ